MMMHSKIRGREIGWGVYVFAKCFRMGAVANLCVCYPDA